MMTSPHNLPVPARAPARRQVNATTLLWGLLVLFALGASGLFLSEAARHGDDVARAEQEAEGARQELAAFEFDASGQLKDPDQRYRFESVVREGPQMAQHARVMRGIQRDELLIAVGAFAGALAFGFLAFRSTRVRPA